MVVATAPCVNVLVITEDSGEQAQPVLKAVLRAAILLVDPDCDTSRVAFEPPGNQAKLAARANAWKARPHGGGRGTAGAHRDQAVMLSRSIAEWLLRGSRHVVCQHFDADQTWSRRAQADTPNAHTRNIAEPVAAILADPASVARDPKAARAALQGDDLERARGRLIEIVPHYSIESWLYQNLSVARNICAEIGQPPDLVAQLEAWPSLPTLVRHESKSRLL